jgi:predicted Zn-dependent peptidase
MESQLAKHLSGWERGEVVRANIAAPAPRAQSGIYIVDKPGAPQSSVRIGHLGTARSTPDYFGLLVANTMLGGAFTSRLNMNLREAKGFTYGAFSRFDMRSSAGPFTARAEVVSAKTDSSVLEFMKELAAIRDTAPQSELDKAKQYLQLQLPDAFETTADIAAQLVPVALYELPLDYYNRYAPSIGMVSQSDAQRVMSAHIHPSQVAIVVVGDRRVIEPGLRKLGFGSVEVRDISGAPLRQ